MSVHTFRPHVRRLETGRDNRACAAFWLGYGVVLAALLLPFLPF